MEAKTLSEQLEEVKEELATERQKCRLLEQNRDGSASDGV